MGWLRHQQQQQQEQQKHGSSFHCGPSANLTNRSLSLIPGWTLSDDAKSISRDFITKNFVAGVTFIKNVAGVAEEEDHHPDVHLTGYRNLRIDLSTHAIGGLSENDFIVAAKINELPVELKDHV